MAETMLASTDTMTNGQVDDLANKVRDAARKHRDELGREAVQEVLRSPNIGMWLFAEFRKRVEQISAYIVHLVDVNRTRTPKEALEACGRKLYVTDSVVETMPRGTGDRAKLVYFKPRPQCYVNGRLSPRMLEDEYTFHNLMPDPQAQIDDNAANPEFADGEPNACQWKDENGNYCSATFDRWRDERRVYVCRRGSDWVGGWSFAGVPQESSALPT